MPTTRHQTSDEILRRQDHHDSAHTGALPDDISVRPLEAHDRPGVAALFERLSPESRRRRFLAPKPRLTARELSYLTAVDHRRHEALAAIDQRDGSIVGVARYVKTADCPAVADAALAVADDMQRRGIGTALAHCLVDRARANGLDVLTASTLWDNRPARLLLRRLGFHARASEGSVIELELDLWAR